MSPWGGPSRSREPANPAWRGPPGRWSPAAGRLDRAASGLHLDGGCEAVGAGQDEATEGLAEPGHLRPDGDHATGVGEDGVGQFRGAQTSRPGLDEGDQQLRVAGREAPCPAARVGIDLNQRLARQVQHRPGGRRLLVVGAQQPATGERVEQHVAEAGHVGAPRLGVVGQGDGLVGHQAGAGRHVTTGVDDGGRPADAAQQVGGGGAQLVQGLPVALEQFQLGQPCREGDGRDEHGVRRGPRAADVHHPEQLPRPRVPQGCGGAPPPGVGLHEVLRALDLDGLPEDQGGPDGVGADVALGPRRPGHEAQVVGHPADRRATPAPQHPALRVADHQQMTGVDNSLQRGLQQGQQPLEPGRRAAVVHLRLGERWDVGVPVRIHARGAHAAPGRQDVGALVGPRERAGQVGLAGTAPSQLGRLQ